MTDDEKIEMEVPGVVFSFGASEIPYTVKAPPTFPMAFPDALEIARRRFTAEFAPFYYPHPNPNAVTHKSIRATP